MHYEYIMMLVKSQSCPTLHVLHFQPYLEALLQHYLFILSMYIGTTHGSQMALKRKTRIKLFPLCVGVLNVYTNRKCRLVSVTLK